jgi:ABC-type dipeptide/oligopeptide/nickel transport system ATPase component
VITVRDLRVTLPPALEGPDQPNCAVAGIDLDIGRGEVVGLVGESGSGKSMTALAIMRLLPQAAASSGSIRLADRELSSLSEREMCQVRGREIGLVFQDATAALNPV